MPSKSPKQARLMAAAAHTLGGYGGVPQSVGREFNKADTGTGILSPPRQKHPGRLGDVMRKNHNVKRMAEVRKHKD